MTEIKKNEIDVNLEPISLEKVSIGDTITINNYVGATRYVVLDKGVPFILIENLKTRFASLYRPDVIYKPINL